MLLINKKVAMFSSTEPNVIFFSLSEINRLKELIN
jgi:hypothetical protein